MSSTCEEEFHINQEFCAPLQQLINEHILLKADMDFYYELIEEIEYDSGQNVINLFSQLYEEIAAFTNKLKVHSKREEQGLFPMISRHLGKNDRTIEGMEWEHEKAERHLKEFLTEAKDSGNSMDENNARRIAVYAFQAHATLVQHFAKEEKFLFPLAEKLLSTAEKNELERFLK